MESPLKLAAAGGRGVPEGFEDGEEERGVVGVGLERGAPGGGVFGVPGCFAVGEAQGEFEWGEGDVAAVEDGVLHVEDEGLEDEAFHGFDSDPFEPFEF